MAYVSCNNTCGHQVRTACGAAARPVHPLLVPGRWQDPHTQRRDQAHRHRHVVLRAQARENAFPDKSRSVKEDNPGDLAARAGFKDELGDLAAHIEALAKSVDEGLQARAHPSSFT
jgi:hypothetical protein